MKCIPNVDVHSNDKDTLSTPIVGSRPCMHPVSTSSSYTENLLVNPLGVLPKNSSSKGLAQEQANNDTLFCFSNSLNKETENLCTTNNISSHQSEATMEDTFSHKEDAFNQNEDVFTYKEDVFNNKGDMVHQKEDAFKIEINYFPSSIENSAFSGTPGRDDTTEQSNIHEITKDETCIIHSINTDRTSNGEISDFGVLSEGHSEISKNLSPQTKDCVTEEVAKESEKQPFSIGVDGVKNTYDHVVNFSHGRNVSNQTMCSTDISQLDHLQIAFTGNSTDTQLILIKQEPVEFEENQQMFTTLQSEIETDNINTQMSGHEFGSENFIIKEEIDPYMECEFQNSTDPGLLSLNSTDPGLLSSNSTDPGLLSSNSTDPGLLSLNSTDPGLLSLNSEVMIAAQKKDRKRKLVKTDKPKKVERNVKNKIKKSKISAVDLESNKTKSVAKGNSKIMKIKINKKSKKLKGNSKIEQKTDSPMIKTHKKCTRARRKKTDFNSDESMNNTHENLNEKARGKTSTEKKCRKPCSKSKNLSTKTKKSGPNKKANSDRKPRTKTKESIPNFMGVQKEQTECVKIVHDIMQDFDSELHLAAKNNNDETVPRSVYHSDEECFGDVIVKTEQDNDPQYYKSQMTFEPGNNITGMKEETGMVMLNSVQESESIKDVPFDCRECGKTYANKGVLHKHMIRHKQPSIKCGACNKMFHFQSDLKRHLVIHTGESSDVCSTCGVSFRTRYHLRRHEQLVHEKKRDYTCGVCDKSFYTKLTRDAHQIEHGGETMFKCDVCLKGYRYKHTFESHKCQGLNHQHNNCTICKKTFPSKRALNQHQLKHKEPKHQCDVCGHQFVWRTSFRKHLKSCKLKV